MWLVRYALGLVALSRFRDYPDHPRLELLPALAAVTCTTTKFKFHDGAFVIPDFFYV